MKNIFLILLGLFCFTFSGCATLVTGSNQVVHLSSTPSGANVKHNGFTVGKTPCSVSFPLLNTDNILFEKEGYESVNVVLHKKFNLWFIGNVICPFFLSAIVDIFTGAWKRFSPDTIAVNLTKKEGSSSPPPSMEGEKEEVPPPLIPEDDDDDLPKKPEEKSSKDSELPK